MIKMAMYINIIVQMNVIGRFSVSLPSEDFALNYAVNDPIWDDVCRIISTIEHAAICAR